MWIWWYFLVPLVPPFIFYTFLIKVLVDKSRKTSEISTSLPMLQMSIASLKGDRVPEGSAESGMEGRKVLHTCDPECDPQGCYGKGPTQCVHCLHYKLDKWVPLLLYIWYRTYIFLPINENAILPTVWARLLVILTSEIYCYQNYLVKYY